MVRRGQPLHGGHMRQEGQHARGIRRRCHVRPQAAEDGGGLGPRVEDDEEEDLGADLVEFVLEARHDAEVAAAAPQGPEQVGVLRRVGRQEAAVGRDDAGRAEGVAAEPVLAPQPAHPAAQRQPGDARLGDDAHRGGEAVGLRRAVQLADGDARLRVDAARRGVYADVPHA